MSNSFLAKGRKEDLIVLANEIGENVPPDSRIFEIIDIITNSKNFEADFVKGMLETIIEERVEKFELQKLKSKIRTKYVKRAKVDGSYYVDCFIDTGSNSNFLKKSIAHKLGLELVLESKAVYGFGNANSPSTKTLGRATVTLEIDDVSIKVEVYLVPDEATPYDLIVGRSFLDSPEISFASIEGKLLIRYANEVPFVNFIDKTNAKQLEKRAIPSLLLEVKSDDLTDGLVVVKDANNYEAALEFEEGETLLPIMYSDEKKIQRKEKQCVSRVVDVSEDSEIKDSSAIHVSENDLNVYSVSSARKETVVKQIHFDESTNVNEKKEIYELVKGKRDCFALKRKEVERDLNNKSTNKSAFHGYCPPFNDDLLRIAADEDKATWTEPSKFQQNYDKRKCKNIKFDVGEGVVMKRKPKCTGPPTKTQPKYWKCQIELDDCQYDGNELPRRYPMKATRKRGKIKKND